MHKMPISRKKMKITKSSQKNLFRNRTFLESDIFGSKTIIFESRYFVFKLKITVFRENGYFRVKNDRFLFKNAHFALKKWQLPNSVKRIYFFGSKSNIFSRNRTFLDQNEDFWTMVFRFQVDNNRFSRKMANFESKMVTFYFKMSIFSPKKCF